MTWASLGSHAPGASAPLVMSRRSASAAGAYCPVPVLAIASDAFHCVACATSQRCGPVHSGSPWCAAVSLCLLVSNTYRTACPVLACHLPHYLLVGCNIPPAYPIGL